MTRQHQIRISIARQLRLSADRFAAAAAVQDPSLLLELQSAESEDDESPDPPRSPRRALTAFDGALLDQAKVAILATVLVAPVLAVAALAALRRRSSSGAEHRPRRVATALCQAP